MRIAVCSDLHLEFQDIDLPNEGADLLILSGDICVERDIDIYDRRQVELGFARNKSVRLHGFFERVSKNFPHVLYVMGNHEHYHGDFPYTVSEMKRKLEIYKNIHVLDKEVFRLDNYVFVGSTLWTNMNNEDPLTLYNISKMMNDFRVVQNSSRNVSFRADVLIDKPAGMSDDEFLMLPTSERFKSVFKQRPAKFSPEDAVEEFKKCFDYIKFVVSEAKPDEKVVVVGHHSPSHRSIAPHYLHDREMNGGYHNNLDEFIMDHPQIALWTHGHTHEFMDYMIGDTRVFCNPRGYAGHDLSADTFTLKIVEV